MLQHSPLTCTLKVTPKSFNGLPEPQPPYYYYFHPVSPAPAPAGSEDEDIWFSVLLKKATEERASLAGFPSASGRD